MSLINCPSCKKKVSDKAKNCPNCHFSFTDSENEVERLKVLKYRKYRNKMYRLKMFSFVSMAIALVGTIPMLWNYLRAIDYGFQADILNHWGINLVIVGFIMYVIVRILMLKTKRNYKA